MQSVAFDRAADYYDRTRGFPPGVEQDVAALMARVGRLTAASRVLEIGIGTGRIALPLAPYAGAYYGIDLARPMMDRLRAKRQDKPIYLTQGDVTRLPFASAAFDAVIAVHVFHLIPGWRDVLSEVARTLRPGAVLLHGWNGRMLLNPLQQVWQEATEETREADGAIPPQERETFLVENGWREAGALETHTFMNPRSPNQFLESIRQRHFSSMWKMTDEQIERGLAAVQAYIDANYAEPSKSEQVESSFHAQAYFPPDSA